MIRKDIFCDSRVRLCTLNACGLGRGGPGGGGVGWLAPSVFVGVVGGWVWWWVMRRVTHDATRGIYITIGDIVAREQVKDHTLSSTPLPPSALHLWLLTTQGSNRHIHSSTQRKKKTMKTVAASLTSKKNNLSC